MQKDPKIEKKLVSREGNPPRVEKNDVFAYMTCMNKNIPAWGLDYQLKLIKPRFKPWIFFGGTVWQAYNCCGQS